MVREAQELPRRKAEDLEGYVDEGVLVFEAGQQAPLPALLTGQA